MTDFPPNLIERAAARLARAAPARSDAPVQHVTPQAPLSAQVAPEIQSIESRPASDTRSGSRRNVILSPTSLAACGIPLPSAGLSRTVEEFRSIKRQVLANVPPDRLGPKNSSSRIVLVTSANEGEGKTFVAINLALALAYEKDTRVLLMDADAYRQSALSYMGISAEAGWVDYVADTSLTADELILDTNIPNLSVLPAGKERHEIPELMSSRRMQQLFEELQGGNSNQIVIVDSLPCLASTEPSILAGQASQTVFVVAAHATSRQDTEASLRLLKASPNVCILLNKAEPLLTEQFKGYGYRYQQQQQPAEPRR